MSYLGIIVTVIMVQLLVRYLASTSNKNPFIDKERVMVLTHSKIYEIIGYIGVGVAAIIGVIASLGTVKSVTDLIIVIFLVLFFLALSASLILMTKKTKIEIGNDKVRYFNTFGKMTEITWIDIREIRFTKSMNLILLSDKAKIKINAFVVGFPSFIDLLKTKVDYEIYKDALYEMGDNESDS